MVGNFLSIPYMVMGNTTGHGIQFQSMGILFNYLCLTCELFLQSIRPSDFYKQLGFPFYLDGALTMAILNNSHDGVETSF